MVPGFLVLVVFSLAVISRPAGPSWIGYGNEGLRAPWRDECRVDFGYPTSVIRSVVDFALLLEEHGTGGMHGYATIRVSLGDRAALYHNHHRTGVDMPTGFGARLEHQQALQHIVRSVDTHVRGLGRTESLRQGDDLQRAYVLSQRTARGDQGYYERGCICGRSRSQRTLPP